GDTRQAGTEVEQAVVSKSNYFDAFFGRGTAYFALGEYPKSIENYEKAKRLKNDNAEVVANLGDAYRQVGDFNKAETNYSLAALFFERQPDFANNKETREIAADTYGKIGFAVGKQCEANIQYAISCKWNVAVDSLKKAVAITNSPNDQANLGWALHNFGKQDIREGKTAAGKEKLEQGREALERAVAANPKFLEGPMLNLGMVYTDLGNNKQAIDTLKKVIQKEPKWVFALNELGIAYMNDGNSKEAAAQFKKAVDRDNKFAAAYYNLAKAEFKNGNLGEAKKAHARLKALGRTDLSIRLEVESRGAIRS
ncbi:MAG: tetratricopeptide repeat protein, partial [Pyrinomonadaceae bacterium]